MPENTNEERQLKTTRQTDKQTKLTLNVTAMSATNTSNRIFNYIAPNLTDDKLLYFGNKLGAMTSDQVNYVQRTNIYKLVSE